MRKLLHHLGLSLFCAVLAAPAAAQQENSAGLGTIKRFYDATSETPNRDVLLSGVAHVAGREYVGSAPAATSGPVTVFANGKRVAQFATPFSPSGGTFDMDTDGKVIFAASSLGVIVFDTAGKTANIKVAAKNGAQTLAKNPIPTPINATMHAVAYDPNGNGGKGSLFVAGTGTTAPILELDLTGKQLRLFANQGWNANGLTVDPRSGNLWCMAAGTGTDIIELDIVNKLKPTGSRFRQGDEWNLRCCGGICGIPGGDPLTYRSDFDIAALTRLPGDDYVYIHRVHLVPGVLGPNEAEIVGGVNTTKLSRGTLGDGSLGAIKTGDTLSWALRPGRSGKRNQPAIVTLGLGPLASVDALNFGGLLLPEWRTASPFSIPPSFTMLFLPAQLVGGPAASVKMPPGILRCFELVHLQAIVFESTSAPLKLLASNEIWAHSSDEKSCTIIVEAVGTNSLNNDTTKGFWRVIHKGGLPIDEVTFDWMPTRDPAQASMRFDIDNTGMADIFNAGNSTTPTCTGTYRNKSDVATGLIYDKLNTPPNSCASSGANTGFIASNGINAAGDVRTLKFRFARARFVGTRTNPKTFEFDCDTDGGKGVDGASMAGCVITIKFLNRRVVAGELRVDPTASVSRSFTGF